MEANKFVRALEQSIADCRLQKETMNKGRELHPYRKLKHLADRIKSLEDLIVMLRSNNH